MQQYHVTFYYLQYERVPWQRNGHLIGLVKIINIHVFRSFEDDLFAMPVRPSQLGGGAGFNQTD